MQRSELMSWLRQVTASSNGVLLWVCLALLLFAVAFWAQRRSAQSRARAERARREAGQADLGGDSYFMPLPVIEQAVEIANPVEIDSLLEGESEAVAARAREMLSAPTGVSTDFDELPAALASALAPPPPPPPPVIEPPRAARPETNIPPTIAIPLPKAMADLQAQMAASRPGAVVSAASAASATAAAARSAATAAAAPAPVALPVQPPPPPPPPVDDISRIPVRDLVLTWFEARGYRAKAVSVRFRPVELELRHHADPSRNYAFIVEREKVTGTRAAVLLKQAKALGLSRLLIAAEAGVDPFSQRELRRLGVRAFDRTSIRSEIESVDLRIAAKIIGVARGRDQARKAQSGAAGGPATIPGPATVPGTRKTEAPANV
jgi:hypothetical protein